jgi:hypothetical protein
VTPADGSGAPEALGEEVVLGPSPDGRWAALEVFGDSGRDIWIAAVDGSDERRPFLATPASETWPRISPNGSYLAYQSNESGRNEIYLQPFPDGGRRWQVSTDGGNWPMWNGDGSELFYVRGDAVMAVPVVAEETVTLGTPEQLFTRNQSGYPLPFDWPEAFDVSTDGQTFLVLQNAADESAKRSIAIVQNWDTEFASQL